MPHFLVDSIVFYLDSKVLKLKIFFIQIILFYAIKMVN